MPRPPQPAARRGTRFHAWVEARFEELRLPMLEPEELPGGDAEIADERDLESPQGGLRTHPVRPPHAVPRGGPLPARHRRPGRPGPYRRRLPESDGDGRRRTRSSTGRPAAHRTADPLQLAVYRLAWAEQQGVPLDSVRAAFLYVRTGEVVDPRASPAGTALERLLLEDPAPTRPARRSSAPDRAHGPPDGIGTGR